MIGDKIKKLRELNNLTAKELAERTGLTASYISQIENNKKDNPTRKTLEKIAKALNTTIENIQEEENKINEYKEKNNIFFSKYEKLSNENKEKINKIIEIFEEETQE